MLSLSFDLLYLYLQSIYFARQWPVKSKKTIYYWATICCVFWPAFGCCAHPKTDWTTFFSVVFNLFCSFPTFFSDFKSEINKNFWKQTKKYVFSVFAYSLKLVEIHNNYLSFPWLQNSQFFQGVQIVSISITNNFWKDHNWKWRQK